MDQVYVAINGDDVGESIGSAIATDNREDLQSATSKIKEVHAQIDSWVEEVGGEVMVSAGDEGIYVLPAGALQYMEDLRQQYAQVTGHTLTVGIGQSMSEASKALIYGKLTEKDQIVEYGPDIEEAMQGALSEEPQGPHGYEQQYEEHLPAEEEMQYQRDVHRQQEQGEHEEILERDADAEEIIDAATEESHHHSKEPEHELDMTAEEELAHDQMEQEADEMDDDIIEADEEAEAGVDEERYPEGTDGDTEDSDDHNVDEDERDEALSDEDESDHDAMLAEMIYSQMEEGGPQEDEMMDAQSEEEAQAMEQASQQLKGDIGASLQAFKQYRDLIEQTQQSHPDFYNALIVMLRSMIEMAKILDFHPEEEMQGPEQEQEMAAQQMMQEQMMQEQPEEYAKSEKPEKK